MVIYIIQTDLKENHPHSNLRRKNPYNSYSALCGVRPFSRDYFTTTSQFYNKEIKKLSADNQRNDFYNKEKGKIFLKFLKNT